MGSEMCIRDSIEEQVVVLEDSKIECQTNPSGTVSLDALIDPVNSSSNIFGGTWALSSGPTTGSVGGSTFAYTEAGCYEFTYTPPALSESADDCEANAESVFVCISEQPQPSFDIQDQVCFSDGDPASVHQYTPLVNSPTYDNAATSAWSVVSGPATVINATTGQIQVSGTLSLIHI